MLRIQRALLLELTVVLLVVIGLVTATVFSGLSVILLARVGDGLAGPLLLKLLPYLLPSALAYALPFSWLVTVILVLGRWVNDHEITSLRAAGVHLRTLVIPALALGAVLTGIGLAIALFWAPAAQHAVREATRSHVQIFLGALKGVDRSVVMGNGRLSFERFEGGVFHGVELDRRDGEGRLELKAIARTLDLRHVTLAEGGAGLIIELNDGYVLRELPGSPPELSSAAGTVLHMAQVKELGGSTQFNSYFGLSRYLARAHDMDLVGLLYGSEWGGLYRSPLGDLSQSLHTRAVQGVSSFVLGLFALGLVLLLPPNGRRVRDFMVTFAPATLLFHPLALAGPGLAGALPGPPWLGYWLPVFLVGTLGAALLFKAARR